MSLRTVYNVLGGTVRVGPRTEAKVRAAMDELGYRPHLLAQGLRKGKTQVLAMMVPELDVPYFAELARIVVAAARDHGYAVMIDQTDGNASREREMLYDLARTRLFDGFLVSALGLTIDDVSRTDVPIVLLGEQFGSDGHDHISIDNVTAAREATDHLLGLGRRRIATIGHRRHETGKTRAMGFIDAHRQRGLPVDDDLVVEVDLFHRSHGAHAVHEVWQQGHRPDGLFCYNDLLALGAMKQLHRMGVSVPDDVAVIGFDGIEDGEYSIPGLSTIAPDKARLATVAVELLIDRIGGVRSGPGEEVTIDHTLVVRGSTGGQD